MQRLGDVSSDLLNQIRNKAKKFESSSVVLDESNRDTAQSLNVIRGITEWFEVAEELASLGSLRSTTGKDLFFSVCETKKELRLPWTKLNEVTKEGAPSMFGKKADFMRRIR